MRFTFVASVLFASACGEVVQPTAAITITQSGNGMGTIESSDGQSCAEATCTLELALGSVVTLTPNAATGSNFTGWTGACESGGPCTFSVTDDASLTAEFTLQKIAVTVTKTGGGVAKIVSSPAGIDCGATCTAEFDYGTMVTLTAEATAGTTLVGWSGGGCSGTSPCATMVTDATTITADLGCDTGSQTFNVTSAIEEFTVPACVTSITIDTYGGQGGDEGGLGARAQGTFAVSGGTKLVVLVGDQGGTAGVNGGGGGGSFVYGNEFALNPLIAAGGGGGKAIGCTPGPGSATTAPTNSSGGAGNAPGGSIGNGGQGGAMTGTPGTPGTGGGGAGFRTAGGNGTVASAGGGGQPPRLTAAGGAAGNLGATGGFGGGGGSAGNAGAGGGGGGYTGGGGGHGWNNSAWGCGGGGGSYNAGTAQINQAGVRMGAGQVIISW